MGRLCDVEIDVTAKQREALMLACKRLGLSLGELQLRVKASCQDAATRKIAEITRASERQAAQHDAGYPDCSECWAMRAETCGRCGVTMTQPPQFEPLEYELLGQGVVR